MHLVCTLSYSYTMAPGGGPESPPPPLPPEITTLRKLVAASDKRTATETQQKIFKKLDNIPSVDLPTEEACGSALNLSEWGLIGQFTVLWTSPKVVDAWVHRNQSPLVK